MSNIVTGLLIVATVLGIGATVVTQGQSGRGAERRPPTVNPPGQQRHIVTVPEPTTLTLLGLAGGSALVARRWVARRRKMSN